jgi:hypothetical protein
MKKKNIIILVSVLVAFGLVGTFNHFKNKFLSAPPNQLSVSATGEPIQFEWQGLTLNGKYEPHAAIFVPVTVPGVDKVLYMQFDTGAHSTVFYYNTLQSINEKYGDVFEVVINEDKSAYVKDVELSVGSTKLAATQLTFRGMGSKVDWNSEPEK